MLGNFALLVVSCFVSGVCYGLLFLPWEMLCAAPYSCFIYDFVLCFGVGCSVGRYFVFRVVFLVW